MGISIRDSGDSDTGAGSSAPADPARASSFFDYARFLQNVRRDYDRAEEMYQRAIEANPKDADILNNYAVLLETVRRDYDRAEEVYQRAIEANPNHANNPVSYTHLPLPALRGV